MIRQWYFGTVKRSNVSHRCADCLEERFDAPPFYILEVTHANLCLADDSMTILFGVQYFIVNNYCQALHRLTMMVFNVYTVETLKLKFNFNVYTVGTRSYGVKYDSSFGTIHPWEK